MDQHPAPKQKPRVHPFLTPDTKGTRLFFLLFLKFLTERGDDAPTRPQVSGTTCVRQPRLSIPPTRSAAKSAPLREGAPLAATLGSRASSPAHSGGQERKPASLDAPATTAATRVESVRIPGARVTPDRADRAASQVSRRPSKNGAAPSFHSGKAASAVLAAFPRSSRRGVSCFACCPVFSSPSLRGWLSWTPRCIIMQIFAPSFRAHRSTL